MISMFWEVQEEFLKNQMLFLNFVVLKVAYRYAISVVVISYPISICVLVI